MLPFFRLPLIANASHFVFDVEQLTPVDFGTHLFTENNNILCHKLLKNIKKMTITYKVSVKSGTEGMAEAFKVIENPIGSVISKDSKQVFVSEFVFSCCFC
jgi:hypothetical protein